MSKTLANFLAFGAIGTMVLISLALSVMSPTITTTNSVVLTLLLLANIVVTIAGLAGLLMLAGCGLLVGWTIVGLFRSAIGGIEPTALTTPGDRMPDGTVYVGISPDSGRPLYAMPYDLPGKHDWEGAQSAATAQTFAGHTDWRVPTKEELDLLYQNRSVIGGLYGDYWSSSEFAGALGWSHSFNFGHQFEYGKNFGLRVRCVRSD
jgi:hypothetical protein